MYDRETSAYVREDERQDRWLETFRQSDEETGCGAEDDRRQFGY